MKTSIYLPDDLAEAVKAHGISISEVAQRALRREIETKTAAQSDRIVVDTETGRRGFVGHWLIDPDADVHSSERGADVSYGIALSEKGNILVYATHATERYSTLVVYPNLNEARAGAPGDIIDQALRALNERDPQPIVWLDA